MLYLKSLCLDVFLVVLRCVFQAHSKCFSDIPSHGGATSLYILRGSGQWWLEQTSMDWWREQRWWGIVSRTRNAKGQTEWVELHLRSGRTIRMDPFTLHRPPGFSVRRNITSKRPHWFMLLVKVSYLPHFLCAFSYLVLPLFHSPAAQDPLNAGRALVLLLHASPLRFTPFTTFTWLSSCIRLLWISGKRRLESFHLLSTLGAHLPSKTPDSLTSPV